MLNAHVTESLLLKLPTILIYPPGTATVTRAFPRLGPPMSLTWRGHTSSLSWWLPWWWCDECDVGNDGGDNDYGDHDDGDHGDYEDYETWSTWVTQTIRYSVDNCVLFLYLTTLIVLISATRLQAPMPVNMVTQSECEFKMWCKNLTFNIVARYINIRKLWGISKYSDIKVVIKTQLSYM